MRGNARRKQTFSFACLAVIHFQGNKKVNTIHGINLRLMSCLHEECLDFHVCMVWQLHIFRDNSLFVQPINGAEEFCSWLRWCHPGFPGHTAQCWFPSGQHFLKHIFKHHSHSTRKTLSCSNVNIFVSPYTFFPGDWTWERGLFKFLQ